MKRTQYQPEGAIAVGNCRIELQGQRSKVVTRTNVVPGKNDQVIDPVAVHIPGPGVYQLLPAIKWRIAEVPPEAGRKIDDGLNGSSVGELEHQEQLWRAWRRSAAELGQKRIGPAVTIEIAGMKLRCAKEPACDQLCRSAIDIRWRRTIPARRLARDMQTCRRPTGATDRIGIRELKRRKRRSAHHASRSVKHSVPAVNRDLGQHRSTAPRMLLISHGIGAQPVP